MNTDIDFVIDFQEEPSETHIMWLEIADCKDKIKLHRAYKDTPEEFSDKKFKIKRVPVQQRGIYAREPYLQKVTYNHSMIPGNEFTGQFYYLNIFFPQLNITAQISE